jgi:hypothetical protein
MKSAAALRHARLAIESDTFAPGEAIRGIFGKGRFTLQDWAKRRQEAGKPVGIGAPVRRMSLTQRLKNGGTK